MPKQSFVLAIDQGTSSTKAIIFNNTGISIAKGHADLETHYLPNVHVEQDPHEIIKNVYASVGSCLTDFQNKGFDITQIETCGISNQRETFLLWDSAGAPQTPAVVWACKRSTAICEDLKAKGQNEFIKQRTGLIIDPYFSGTKLVQVIQESKKLQAMLKNGELYFGTIDTWLLFNFSGGKSYKTDFTNAHRTLFFNIHSLSWDQEILKLWGLEQLNLPEVCSSAHRFGQWHDSDLGLNIPISALIGDSHAATFGEGCFESGTAKITLGTGCSIMLNVGNAAINSGSGLLSTVCWSMSGRVDFALEGAIVACGSTIEWLKNELNLFSDPSETAQMAMAVSDSAGVVFIPAFSGLGAPHWQMSRRASIHGMTFGTTKNHIVRAALESIAFQIKDVIDAMNTDLNAPIKGIAVNGGLSKNKFIVSILSQLLQIPIYKQDNPDVSALGVAYLAGLHTQVFDSLDQIMALHQATSIAMLPEKATQNLLGAYARWKELINQ